MADVLIDEQSAPATPASGKGVVWADNSGSMLAYKSDGGEAMLIGRGAVRTSLASQALSGTETIPTNAQFVIPSFGLVTGAAWRFTWSMSKTNAGIAAPTFNIKIGSAGTVSDTTRFTITGPAQTAAVDTGRYELIVQLRSAGAAAVLSGHITGQHTAATGAGFGTANASDGYQIATSAAFDSTTAVGGWFVSLSLAPGASAVWTIDHGFYMAAF